MLTVISRPSSKCFNFAVITFNKNMFRQLLIRPSRCQSKCTLSMTQVSLLQNSFNKNVFPTLGLVKYKSTKSKKYRSKKKYEDDDDDDDDDDDERKVKDDDDYDDDDDADGDRYTTKGSDTEIKTYSVTSLRVDTLLKTSFKISRRKVEEKFYNKKIWVNGRLLLKKGNTAKIGDTVDMIVDFVKDQKNLIIVRRLELLNIEEDDNNDERLLVKVRKIRSLYIPNYEGNKPYMGNSEE